MMKKKTTKINENISISKLLEQGNLALNKAQPELALKFFEKAYNLNQNNTEILENLIEVLLQLNENEKAYSYLCHSIEIEPLKNPCKYLYIAQLQQGKISLESYKKGISLLIQEKNENNVEVSLFTLFNLLNLFTLFLNRIHHKLINNYLKLIVVLLNYI